MSITLVNSFIEASALAVCGKGNATELVVAESLACRLGGDYGVKTHVYKALSENSGIFNVQNPCEDGSPLVYIPQLFLEENRLNALVDFVFEAGAHIMVKTAATLTEVGLFDSKYKLSPIMLLHKLGILGGAIIVGGVYLDKDDTALMQQEGARIVLTPSCDFGRGNGVPPLVSYINSGVEIALGTGDCKFNPNSDLLREAYLLYMATCAVMNKEGAVKMRDLSKIVCGSEVYSDDLERLIF